MRSESGLAAPVVTAIIGLLVVGGGGAAGWYIMTLRQQQAATQGRLRQAESSLRETESALTLARDEHQRLASEYDALKQRWNEADAEVAHLTQRVTQLQGRMDTLTSERASLESQVREAQERANGLESKVSALRREAAEAEGARIALEADLRLAMAQSLTLAEAEQVAEIHAQSEAEVRRLHELLEEGADAYEELMARSDEMERQLVAILQAPPSGKGARAVAAVQPPVGSQPLRPATAQHLAKLHRRLGESYVATYQYPKAARAFEQSLTYKDDAVVHAKLAFIYTRLLPNVELAERHLALAAPGYPAKIALDDAARASDLPRSNLKMVMKWLTE